MTETLFREDAYRRETAATVLSAEPRGVALDRTVFYPQGGGQPGDQGVLELEGGAIVRDRQHDLRRRPQDHPARSGGGRGPARRGRAASSPGSTGTGATSACAPIPRCICFRSPCPTRSPAARSATREGRLDFDCEAPLDKAEVERKLNELIALDAAVGQRWITDEELDANPALVKTMSVKPPRGSGRVRLVAIEAMDLQPCGGTHVARTGEIGRASVTQIEKKGRLNRRVRIVLSEP